MKKAINIGENRRILQVRSQKVLTGEVVSTEMKCLLEFEELVTYIVLATLLIQVSSLKNALCACPSS